LSKFRSTVIFFYFLAASVLFCVAQTSTVANIGALADTTVSTGLRNALQPQGSRVTINGSVVAEIWLRQSLPARDKTDVPDVIYPQLAESALVAVISFPAPATDYRGEAIKPGTYTLRYQLLPEDGNHLGVAPNRDFLLLIPVASDSDPDATYKFDQLVSLSRQATGTRHPAPMSMVAPSAGNEPTISKDIDEHWIFSAKLKSGTTGLPLAFVVQGTAPQ
jgi:hypothetical protein